MICPFPLPPECSPLFTPFVPGFRCADGEEERRADRHWREVGRGGGEIPEDPATPEDRERWRERRFS